MDVGASHETRQGVWIGDSIVVEHPYPVGFELECPLLADSRTSCRPTVVFQANNVDVLPVFLGRHVRDAGPIVDDDDPVGSLGSV
jgi:hypothetical protein